MALLHRLSFLLSYWQRQTPWDTHQTPPEVIAAIEPPGALVPGRALDLGCGTGTNVLYLARHGWQVVGVDFAPNAIARAHRKLARAGLTPQQARCLVGDVTHLPRLPLGGAFDLALDIGCFHGLPPAERPRYAEALREILRPGATYLLYTFAPRRGRWHMVGVEPTEVERLFADGFAIQRVEWGTARHGQPSAWFTMRAV